MLFNKKFFNARRRIMNKKTIFFLALLLLSLTAMGCTPAATSTQDPLSAAVASPGDNVIQNALDVVGMLKTQDMVGLAAYVHPEKGLRFGPYGGFDTGSDQLFQASSIPELLPDTQTYVWGKYDGTGFPIELTFSDYFDEFVYDVDFANPHIIGNNVMIASGNSPSNIMDFYPDSVFVEFHFTGFEPDFAGIDWESLRLVFEQIDDTWYLIGIIHDQWTI